MVHYNSAIRLVNLGIHLGVLDKVSDPLLTLLRREIETSRELLNIDALVDSAVKLGNQVSGRVKEGVGEVVKEEVVCEDRLSLEKLRLSFSKVVVNVESTNKVCDGVLVLVQLLADNTDKVLESALVAGVVAALGVERDDGSGKVADNPGAGSLDSGNIRGGEEKVDKAFLVEIGVLEEEKRPVDDPGTVMKLSQGVGK